MLYTWVISRDLPWASGYDAWLENINSQVVESPLDPLSGLVRLLYKCAVLWRAVDGASLSVHPWPENWVAVGHAVVYHARCDISLFYWNSGTLYHTDNYETRHRKTNKMCLGFLSVMILNIAQKAPNRMILFYTST